MHKKQRENYDRILKCVTHLIYLLIETASTPGEEFETRMLVHKLVKKNPRSSSTEDTLLHLCVSSLNTINSSYFTAEDVQVRRLFNYNVELSKMYFFINQYNISNFRKYSLT